MPPTKVFHGQTLKLRILLGNAFLGGTPVSKSASPPSCNIARSGCVLNSSMKTSKWLVITLAAAVAAGGLFTLTTRAENPAAARGQFRGRLLERAKEKLGLSDAQVTQIKAVLKGDKVNPTSLLARLHAARAGLRSAIQAPDATEASVRAASAKVAAAEADLAVERLRLFGKISPILTEDQRAKLSEMQSRLDEFADGVINRIGERLAE
jgi:Spy/CpxP family protein refolding chaperone